MSDFIEELEKAKKYYDDLKNFTSQHWDCDQSIKDERDKAQKKYLELNKKRKLFLSKEVLKKLQDIVVEYEELSLFNVESDIEILQKHIRQEECPHENTHNEINYGSHYKYDEVICKDCGKTISSEKY